jgi:hypothetical protein
MNDSGTSQTLYQELRQMAYEDPLAAKQKFLEVLDEDEDVLQEVLQFATAPSDSRLRMLIARSVQRRSDRSRLTGILTSWRGLETDEFTLAAIDDALAGTPGKPPRAKPADLPDLANTFRFISGRLRHRVLNMVPRTALSLEQLRDEIILAVEEDTLPRLLLCLDDLKTCLRRLEQSVNFDAEAAHFAITTVHLPQWLQEHANRFQAEFGPTLIRVDFDYYDQAKISASPYLLDLVFSNLWLNSRQAVGDACRITVQGKVEGKKISIL